MNYSEAIVYLDGFVNFERSFPGIARHGRTAITLDRVCELASRLNNPQDTFPTLHVAGTKGKGSTCAFAARGSGVISICGSAELSSLAAVVFSGSDMDWLPHLCAALESA